MARGGGLRDAEGDHEALLGLFARLEVGQDVQPRLVGQGAQGREEMDDFGRRRFGLAGRAEHHPSQLSGGQQQRVAIARALVNEPALLLADEPTGNLDTRTSLEIMGIFQELNRKGMTILMVTHEPDIAKFCLRGITMRDGRIVSDRPIESRLTAADELAKWRGPEEAAS